MARFSLVAAFAAAALLIGGSAGATTFTGTAAAGPDGDPFVEDFLGSFYLAGEYRYTVSFDVAVTYVAVTGALFLHREFYDHASGELAFNRHSELGIFFGPPVGPFTGPATFDYEVPGAFSTTQFEDPFLYDVVGYYVLEDLRLQFDLAPNQVANWTVTVDEIVSGGVPEPAAWSLMIAGFGLAGGAIRRRRAAGGVVNPPAGCA